MENLQFKVLMLEDARKFSVGSASQSPGKDILQHQESPGRSQGH